VRSGQKVGKYVLGERIARGGMAEVWAARVEGPEGFVKSVALKFVVDPGDPEMERLFVNEARVAAGLQHPNLVTVFDFDRVIDATELGCPSPGRYYIAMERIEGHDLRRVLRTTRDRGQRFPVGLSLHVAGEVLKGLRYLHERPASGGTRGPILVHRDVSPHNILIAYAGDVKLSDFGIAKVVTRVPGAESGLVRGKVAYASPEQVLGQPVDHRSDQFSLGVTLWEMLAGERLFGGTTDVETMNRVLAGDIPELPRDLGIARELESFVRRMLAASPEARHPTTAAALSGLMALPGYPGDGASLGEWMLTALPPRAPAVLPATQLLPVSVLEPALAAGGPPRPDGRGGARGGVGVEAGPGWRPAPGLAPGAGGKVVAGSTLWLDDGVGAGLGKGTADETRRPVGEPGRAGTPPARSAAFRAPAASKAPGAGGPKPGPAAPTRTPARRATPVLIDFATRAPVGAAWGGWGRWGMVAAAVALLAWGAALGLRRFVSGTAVASPERAAHPSRRASREARALGRDLPLEIVAAPARSAAGEGASPASGAPGAAPGDEAPVAAEDEDARANRHVPSASGAREDPAESSAAGGDDDRTSRPGSGWLDTAPLGRHVTTRRGSTGAIPNGAPIIE
jgi:hypothetical protein